MKLAAKFARQETEEARVARIGRRRIAKDREAAVRRMLSLPAEAATATRRAAPPRATDGAFHCADCARTFKLAMHWARHRSAKHGSDVV